MIRLYLTGFLFSILLSLGLTWLFREIASAMGLARPPIADHHVHTYPVPRLGGVAVYLAIVSACGFFMISGRLMVLPSLPSLSGVAAILVPATVIFTLGVYDDSRGATPRLKLTIEVLAAILLFRNGIGINAFHELFGSQHLAVIASLLLTVFWIVGIVNAFNLIDGLDGLAAGSALLSTAVLFIVSLLFHNQLGSFLAPILGGAVLGFLRFNFNPASIFLGDCGSLLIGFMVAAIALTGAGTAPMMAVIGAPLVAFGLPILDVCWAILRRYTSSRPLFGADRDHIHHNLIKRGFSHRQAVVVLYFVSASFCVVSLVLLAIA